MKSSHLGAHKKPLLTHQYRKPARRLCHCPGPGDCLLKTERIVQYPFSGCSSWNEAQGKIGKEGNQGRRSEIREKRETEGDSREKGENEREESIKDKVSERGREKMRQFYIPSLGNS